MKEKDKKSCCCSAFSSYVLRIAVGGLLLVMAIAKLKMGVGTFVGNATGMFEGTIMPMVVAKGYLTIVPFAEVVLGALIVVGLYTRLAAHLAALMFALFVVGLASTGNADMYGMMTNNFIYLFASLWLAKKGAGKISVDKMMCGNKCEC